MPFNYSALDGNEAIIIPDGALDRWFSYRDTMGAVHGDLVMFGDSTTFGSGGLYALTQRLRDRAVSYGIADGGKGMFAAGEDAIAYDAPEVNGFVSSSFAGFGDSYDNLSGGYFYDDGVIPNATITFQFRATGARLWYTERTGGFSYSVNGGAQVSVGAVYGGGAGYNYFKHISGLAADTTHTVTITNDGGGVCRVALAPMNATGLTVQKFARSGNAIAAQFFASAASAPFTQAQYGSRYQTPLGLVATQPDPPYTGTSPDETYTADARVTPVLALSNLGFNDLTNSSSSADLPMWVEYVTRFAGACSDADCDGIIVSGNLPLNANWPTYGADRFNAMKDQAAIDGLSFVDLFYPVGGSSLEYAGSSGNPHLTRSQYEDQADFLWDSLLGVDVALSRTAMRAVA